MISYFRFNNFYSYDYDEDNIVSFTLGKQPRPSNYDFNIKTKQNNYRLNKVMAVMGANGSGKTQLLKAFSFLRFFISGSKDMLDSDESIPYKQFALSETDISEFELGFFLKNNDKENEYDEYRYELKITKNSVFREALFKKTSRLFSYVFVRHYEKGEINYKYRNFISTLVADDAKKNTSLISHAYYFDDPLAHAIVEMLFKCKTNVSASGRLSGLNYSMIEITELFNKNENLKAIAENILCQFDTGINHINIRETLMVSEDDKKSKKVLLPYGVHKVGNDKEFELLLFDESNGTQSAYGLLGLILPVLNSGGLAVVDELDNDLHPHLLPAILDLFRSSYHNPHNAQLIFSCHTPEVFNLLNKHQIYLVEKYDQVSKTWRLDEMDGVRNDDNLYAKYMAGAFDAVPNL